MSKMAPNITDAKLYVQPSKHIETQMQTQTTGNWDHCEPIHEWNNVSQELEYQFGHGCKRLINLVLF